MRTHLHRIYRPEQTIGHLYVIDDSNNIIKTCAILELPWRYNNKNVSCIPEMVYWVEKMAPNQKRNYTHFWVKDVPDREGILVHTGNYRTDILGCLLPGIRHTDLNADGLLDVENSTPALASSTRSVINKLAKNHETTNLTFPDPLSFSRISAEDACHRTLSGQREHDAV